MKKDQERIITLDIYTDGSSKSIGSTRFGGWAFIAVKDGNKVYEAADSEQGATNQRMELMAILKALKYAQGVRLPYERVVLYSDSAYAINCYKQQWYASWLMNGWKTTSNKDVINIDLWNQIIPFFENFWYNFEKIEGHSGVVWNELCDKLAQTEAEKLKKKWRGK